jgi:radical SAM protein with 4Fe4S-binding SPASM domain
MDGDRSILGLGIPSKKLSEVFRDPDLVGNVDDFCAPPAARERPTLDGIPCSAGHTYCYISPYGDVYPCVQFPLPCGNVLKQQFLDVWRRSAQLNEVRSIRDRDLPTCSRCSHIGSCTRCPGLAYMEGNMRGPSSQDCEKSFARTGIPSENLKSKKLSASSLVQIKGELGRGASFGQPAFSGTRHTQARYSSA